MLSSGCLVKYIVLYPGFVTFFAFCTAAQNKFDLTDLSSKVPVVFVYTLIPRACHMGIPRHMVAVVDQAHRAYSNSVIVMISNFKECNTSDPVKFFKSIDNLTYVHNIDTHDIASNRTKQFYDLSGGIYHKHADPSYKPGLWVTSTLRFFLLEDLMYTYNFKEMLHIESDNMIYGPWESVIIPALRLGYKGLAATRLNGIFVTASVFWVANIRALTHFTEYLLGLARRSEIWTDFIAHIRNQPGSAKGGGLEADAQGKGGIKPAFVNEMSMLAFYMKIESSRLLSLPIIPSRYFVEDKNFNKSEYASGGRLVGPATGEGIYDPNSWGQFLGGTGTGHRHGFIDNSHLIGTALKWHGCTVSMLCDATLCTTAPFVRCGYSPAASDWTPLYNLHVHSKRTASYLSEACPCNLTLS